MKHALAGELERDWIAALDPVNQAQNPQWIRGLELFRHQRIGKILKADRPREAVNRRRAHRRKPRVGSGRIGAAVDHSISDLDTGGKAVEDEPSRFLFEHRNQFPMRGKIFFA